MDYHDSYRASPVLRCIPEFLLGVWITRLYLKERPLRFLQRRFVPEMLALSILLLNCFARTDALVVLLFPALILALAYGKGLLNSWLGKGVFHHLGVISYSIYLVHDLMGGMIGWVHSQASVHNLAHGQSYGAAVALVLTYVGSYAAYHFIEKPGRDFLRVRLNA